jgi:nitrate reductase beta subunit
MVWYVPPLSPIDGALAAEGYDTDPDDVFPAIERMRIPVEYLANLLSAGDADVIRRVLRRLAAMRGVMRALQLGGEPREELARSVGLDVGELEAMYRLLAIAKYDERYVIPTAHAEGRDPVTLAHGLEELATECSLDYEGGPGMTGPFGEASGAQVPIAVENYHMLKQRQRSDTFVDPGDGRERVNLLNWDGKGGAYLPPPEDGS